MSSRMSRIVFGVAAIPGGCSLMPGWVDLPLEQQVVESAISRCLPVPGAI